MKFELKKYNTCTRKIGTRQKYYMYCKSYKLLVEYIYEEMQECI